MGWVCMCPCELETLWTPWGSRLPASTWDWRDHRRGTGTGQEEEEDEPAQVTEL